MMNMAPHQTIDENGDIMSVLDHLKSVFGHTPMQVGTRRGVTAYFWPDASVVGEGVICSVGMSERAQALPSEVSCPSREPRTELLALCQRSDAGILAELLLDLAEYPFEHGRHLFWWQTMPLGRQLVSDSWVTGVLFSMPPISADQMTFEVHGRRIDIVWVIPILDSELAYARQGGIEALEELLETNSVDVADIRRTRMNRP